jgi:hypothetical protein
VAENPSVQTWLAAYLRSLAATPAQAGGLLGRLPGASAAAGAFDRVAGGAVEGAEQRGREFSEWLAGRLLERWADESVGALDDQELADALLELWDEVCARPVGDLLGSLHEEDLVDVLVIGYDAWLHLRSTPYLLSLIDAGIDYVFDRYGSYRLDELLAEFGLDRGDLVEEAMRFAPRAIEALAATGILDDLVRRRLAAFYRSPEARGVLALPD